jgi:hypothetical protein
MRVAESSLEIQFLKVAQLDPGVTCVRAQPCWLSVVEHGKLRRRAPDFAVMYQGQAELHEVKPDDEYKKPEIMSELLAVNEEVERHPAWYYSISLESSLFSEPLRHNTDTLWRALRPYYEIDTELLLAARELLGRKPTTGNTAIRQLSSINNRIQAKATWDNLLSIIAASEIHFHVAERLTPDSSLWIEKSGPKRLRTLPFQKVSAATHSNATKIPIKTFCSVELRR